MFVSSGLFDFTSDSTTSYFPQLAACSLTGTMPPTHAASPKPILRQQDSYADECASPSSYLGLSYKVSPRSTPK
ncbi:hypothetical protein LTR33_015805, partial [Friedmanniomyces endolithicus]